MGTGMWSVCKTVKSGYPDRRPYGVASETPMVLVPEMRRMTIIIRSTACHGCRTSDNHRAQKSTLWVASRTPTELHTHEAGTR
jgi:hypothetical protein